MADLKRCPFCGELPTTEVLVTQKGGLDGIIFFSIVCGKCGISKGARLKTGTFFEVEKAMEEAVKAWNTRWDNG